MLTLKSEGALESLLDFVYKFYEDPANREAYEKWAQAKEAEGHEKTFS